MANSLSVLRLAAFAGQQGQGIQVDLHRGGRTAERWLLICDSPARFEAECQDMSHQG